MTPRNVNLHPQTHGHSTLPTHTFDIIFLGSGPVANIAAARLAQTNLSVLVIEAELYGGDCPFWACIPSKALLRPIEALAAARAVGGAREKVQAGIDVGAVFARRDGFVRGWDDSFLSGWAESNGVTIVRGWGRLEGAKRVSVQGYEEEGRVIVDARHAVVLATGSEPVFPSVTGLEELERGTELWDPRDATATNSVPEHLVIVGAGAVGVEAATTFVGLGGKVTVITSGVDILTGFESHAASFVRTRLNAQGVEFHLESTASHVKRHGRNDIEVILSSGASIRGTTLLIATGRRPRTTDIGLDTVPRLSDLPTSSPVPTSSSLSVDTGNNEQWLYAIGDVNGRNATTHSGIYHARIASNAILSHLKSTASQDQLKSLNIPLNFLEHTRITTEPHAIPRTLFTSPAVASVGHTLASALAAGLRARQISADFSFPGALLWADGQIGEGWACWIVASEDSSDGEGADEERLIGATYVGNQVEELLMPATLAVSQRMRLAEMVGVVPCFPTRGEVWRVLLDAGGY